MRYALQWSLCYLFGFIGICLDAASCWKWYKKRTKTKKTNTTGKKQRKEEKKKWLNRRIWKKEEEQENDNNNDDNHIKSPLNSDERNRQAIHRWIVAREGKMSQLKFLEVSIESISKRWPDYLCVCVCSYTLEKNIRLKMNTHHGWWRWRWWSQQPLTHSHEWRKRHHINALSSGIFFLQIFFGVSC